MLRAYDKVTGRAGRRHADAGAAERLPMTYMVDGKQYIVVAISGGSYSGEYIAFTPAELTFHVQISEGLRMRGPSMRLQAAKGAFGGP